MKRFTTATAFTAAALLGAALPAVAGTANGFFPIQDSQRPEYAQAIARAEARDRASAYALTGQTDRAEARSATPREVSVPGNGNHSITVYDYDR